MSIHIHELHIIVIICMLHRGVIIGILLLHRP